MFIFSTHLWTVVPSVVVTCALVSGQLPLGENWSLLRPVIQACHTEKKAKAKRKQSYDKTDAYGFRKLFLPRYSPSVCVWRCGWGVGTCLQLTHGALSALDRERKTGYQNLAELKVRCTSGEFFQVYKYCRWATESSAVELEVQQPQGFKPSAICGNQPSVVEVG